MKPKKFSQIYREAAESLFNHLFLYDRPIYIHGVEEFPCWDYPKEEDKKIIKHFKELFFTGENFTSNNHRITALLLASEIAKSEGL